MVELRTPGEIDAMAAAGAVVARVLAASRTAAVDGLAGGVTPLDIDAVAQQVIADQHATSCYIGYHPVWAPTAYPAVTCISVNDEVVHVIPSDRRLQPGDLVSVDIACSLDGWAADAAISFVLGDDPDPKLLAQIETTERALAAGIEQMHRGNQLGDVSAAIGAVARAGGYGLLADHGGHGIGREMHGDPHVPNEGRPHRGMKFDVGLVLALEPMLLAGGKDGYVHLDDGWGVRTADGSMATHVEHTVAITPTGPRILTVE
ncbi:type I methionyl aminopeptidase [Nakamurella lactea]|uniref:type I methionyl aminopeptidase n=1 Tax=Nakamurella lactea TaxID=459515 RepID=UPI00041B1F28|nr:type I methionyl aminopeptidase [Nakamurella lactea]